MSNPTKILIIGGGLAGLSLGHALKAAQIPFTIYERDTTASFRAQGYRIRISPDGAGALRHLLPEQLWQAFKATCAPVIPGGCGIDAKTGLSGPGFGAGPRPPPQSGLGPGPGAGPGAGPGPGQGGDSKWTIPDGVSYNADRTVLRNVLLSGLDDDIEFGKRFTRYEVTANGEVVAHFDDDTSAKGRSLVGADGIHSRVRKQLFPAFELLDTEGRAVFGKTNLTPELKEKMAEGIGKGMTLAGVAGESRVKLFCDGMVWERKEAEGFASFAGGEIPADYIYWVLLFRKDVVDEEQERKLLSLSNEDSVQLSKDLAKGWSESLHVLFDLQAVDAAATLSFSLAAPQFESNWASKPVEQRAKVVVIGDSAHPMPPVGGVGANSGFQDSADLFEALTRFDSTPDSHQREQLVSDFEQSMLGRAKLAVERSAFGAGRFFAMKPVPELRAVRGSH